MVDRELGIASSGADEVMELLDWLVCVVYLCGTVVVGVRSSRESKTSDDYFSELSPTHFFCGRTEGWVAGCCWAGGRGDG